MQGEACLTEEERIQIKEMCKRDTLGPILEGEAALAALRWLEQLRDQIQACLPPLTDEEREQLMTSSPRRSMQTSMRSGECVERSAWRTAFLVVKSAETAMIRLDATTGLL